MHGSPPQGAAHLHEAGGASGALLRAHDWASTDIGYPAGWPPGLHALVDVMLGAKQPMFIAWGPERVLLFNDGYGEILGSKRATAMGKPFFEVWPEARSIIEPLVDQVFAGEPVHMDDIALVLERNGRAAEAHFAFSYTPVRDELGRVAGMFCTCTETTAQVLAARRQAFRLTLEERLRDLAAPRAIMEAAVEALGPHLGANRVGYGKVLDDGVTVCFETNYVDGVAPLLGAFPLDGFGSASIARHRRGETVVADDVATDVTYDPATWRTIEARSFASVPLVREDRLRATLYVNFAQPHHWSPDEVALIEDVAARTWDAVDRARAEADLRHLNETLEQRVTERTAERDRLWRNSQDLLVVIDLKGVFQEVSPAATKILGWAPEEMIGHDVFEFIHPDDHPSTDGALSHATREELPIYLNRYRHKAGGYRWMSWVAAPEGELIYATGRHVTAEKEAADALAGIQARLRTLFETSYQLQAYLGVDGTLIDANAASLAVIEARREDVIGKPFWDTPWFTGTPGMPEMMREGVEAALRGTSFRQEVTVDLPSGARTFDFSIRPIRDGMGAIIGIVPEAMDLTDRRRTEEALRQAQKMEAVGQLTGGIAHDFNNLLTGISGSLELLQSRMAQGRLTDLDKYINAAQGASKRAAALTHRLLAFSRRQTLDPKPTNINALVAGMEEMIRRTVGPAITIEVVGAAGLWPALVDPHQLENALLNLCINARDAMPDGGRITIETANKWLDARTGRERDLEPGQYLSLCVTDTGTGMTPDVITRAFDPFFTTKPIGQGTGLGLSMIHGFVRQSGGQVRVYSEVGQGTTMCLYLPRHYGEAEWTDVLAGLSEAPRAEQGMTVLVVDDEPTVRMLVTEVLQELGYTAIEAADGPSGLKVLQSNVRIDLLVTDVGLPGGMNGRQVADAGRTVRPGLRVLFITGYAENAVVGNGHLEPGMAVLTKPFVMESLATCMRDLITGK